MMRFHPRRFLTYVLFLVLLGFIGLIQYQQDTILNLNPLDDLLSDPIPAKAPPIAKKNVLPNYKQPTRDNTSFNYHYIQISDKSMEKPSATIKGNFSSKYNNSNSKEIEQTNLDKDIYKFRSLFPHGDEVNDRVLVQLSSTFKLNRNVTILMWNGLDNSSPKGNKRFIKDKCPVKDCLLTADKGSVSKADAVVFMHSIPPSYRRSSSIAQLPNQVRILYILESPHHSLGLNNMDNMINWTATYRRDSVINTPYERFTPFQNASGKLPTQPKRNYATGKSKHVAWFVSNCRAPNGRDLYVTELQKYIDVDIYGACGKYKCPRSSSKKCYKYLNEDYRFYLAFENSNCKDYITEKLFWNALANDVVPIVMGAHPEDYKRSAPPHSYIHVDEFDSPKHLAEYLHKLANDDDLYNSYFRWKGTGEFINTKFFCRLCSMVHVSAALPSGEKMWYPDPNKWWRGQGVCVKPDKKPWATWRNSTRDLTFLEGVTYG